MANYTIPDQIIIPQSVGPHEEPDNENSGVFNVFQPKQGRDLFYLNPLQNSGSTEIVDDFDKRLPLGTYTLNDRGLWESNITNKENYILLYLYLYRNIYLNELSHRYLDQ